MYISVIMLALHVTHIRKIAPDKAIIRLEAPPKDAAKEDISLANPSSPPSAHAPAAPAAAQAMIGPAGIFAYEAGQYIGLTFDGLPRRLYSIANAPNGRSLEIHLRDNQSGGAGSYAYHQLKHGEKVTVDGPYGHCTLSALSALEGGQRGERADGAAAERGAGKNSDSPVTAPVTPDGGPAARAAKAAVAQQAQAGGMETSGAAMAAATAPQVRRPAPVLLIAGGIGITPFKAMIEAALNEAAAILKNREIHLFWGADTAQELYIDAEIAALAAKSAGNIHYTPVIGQNIGEILLQSPMMMQMQAAPDDTGDDMIGQMPVFLTGPQEMMARIVPQLLKAGVRGEMIFSDDALYLQTLLPPRKTASAALACNQ